MHGTIRRIILTTVIVFSFCLPSAGLAKSVKRLMTINSIEYTNEDFANWWRHWNDKNELKFPDNPDEFIGFQLMVQQGLEMGYDTKPSYLRKIDVFLQVKAMMALKDDEIDSKVKVTDADLRKYFAENYSDLWVLQILAFDTEAKAQKAYEYMMPYKGQLAGKLVFADLYGGSIEEKADTYDEVTVSVADFHKNKKDAWLAVARKMEIGEVSQPFYSEDIKKYMLLRLTDKQSAGEDVFEEKKQKMYDLLHKEKRNILTIALIDKLKRKYAVQVDNKLFDEIKFDVDYPKEFLDSKLVVMDGFEFTVNNFIYNALKEKQTRKNAPDDVIKRIILDSVISQTLINKESLARGYEKQLPLLPTFEFYKQNRLKLEVEAGLMSTVSVSDQDVQNYYETNIASYSVPDKYTFILLEGDQDLLNKIWVGTLQGGDFTDLAKKYSLEANSQTKGVDSLSPALVSELKKMNKGSVSLPFKIADNFSLLKLVDRVPGLVQPLAEVKGNILEQLKKEKFEIIKAEYLTKLKSRSQIDIDERVWNGLSRELANGKKD